MTMRLSQLVLGFAVGGVAIGLGCSGANRAPVASAPAAAGSSVLQAGPVSPAPVSQVPRVANDTLPAGLVALSDDEVQQAESECKALADALAEHAKQVKEKLTLAMATEFFNDLPQTAPIKATNVPKCAGLILRDMKVYIVRLNEEEAIRNLQLIGFGMKTAFEAASSVLCPSAPPLPADLNLVKGKTYKSAPQEWSAPGWTCAQYTMVTLQQFQYELRTDPKTNSFEAIARGYPLNGGPLSELFFRGEGKDGRMKLAHDVMRR